MFETFEQYILAKGNFTGEQIRQMCAAAILKKLRRRQLLLSEGEVCRHKIFVTKGMLRTFRLKEDGTEHIMRFAPENNWSVEHESYTHATPSKYYIEAIEDSEVIMWTRERMNELFASIPLFRMFSEQLKEQSLDKGQQRILVNISCTAEEKYHDFIDTYPDIFNRVPLHMVASYLGVSRETLSRVRHAQIATGKKQSAG